MAPPPVRAGSKGAVALENAVEAELAARFGESVPRCEMAEYIVAMFVHRNGEPQVAVALVDFIGDEAAPVFARWLFEHVESRAAEYGDTEDAGGQAMDEGEAGREAPPRSMAHRLRSAAVPVGDDSPARPAEEGAGDEIDALVHAGRRDDWPGPRPRSRRVDRPQWFDHDDRMAPPQGRGYGQDHGDYGRGGSRRYESPPGRRRSPDWRAGRQERRVEYVGDRRGGRRSRSRSPDWRWQQGWQRLEEGGEREGAVRLLARAAGASGGGGVFDRLAAAPPGSVFDRLAPAAEGGAGQRRASVFDRMNPGGGQGGVLSRLRPAADVGAGMRAYPQGEAEEDPDSVEAMKRRLRKAQLEMVKLVSAQKEIVQDLRMMSPTAAKLEVDTRSVVVQNVHFSANEHVVGAHFITVGQIKRVTIAKDKLSRAPKGYAYIEFFTPAQASKALALSGSLLLGRPIKVVMKESRVKPALPAPAPPALTADGAPVPILRGGRAIAGAGGGAGAAALPLPGAAGTPGTWCTPQQGEAAVTVPMEGAEGGEPMAMAE
eukprot:jgi/Tetstr1/441401/TSEL_029648.t1